MEVDANGWTLRSLKEYIDRRFDGLDRAIDKALTALDYRLEAMNQFRQQIERERREYVTMDKHDELDDRIDELRRTYVTVERFESGIERVETRMTGYESWQNKMVGALALVGLVLPIVSALIVYWATHP